MHVRKPPDNFVEGREHSTSTLFRNKALTGILGGETLPFLTMRMRMKRHGDEGVA